MKKLRNYATMTPSACVIVRATSKKQAAEKLGVKVKDVYFHSFAY